jgi:adhesin transport system outer membrane protein
MLRTQQIRRRFLGNMQISDCVPIAGGTLIFRSSAISFQRTFRLVIWETCRNFAVRSLRIASPTVVAAFCAIGLVGCETGATGPAANAPVNRQSGSTGEALHTGSVRVVASKPSEALRIRIDGMNLAEAIGIAISRHPDISRANAVVAQSASEVAIAKSAWYPALTYNVQPGYGTFGGERKAGLHGSLGVTQLIYDFGKTPGQVSTASATLSQRRHLLNDTTETVAYETAAVFVELGAGQDMKAAAARQVKALQDIHAKIRQRVQAGLSDASDQSQADVAIQRASAEGLKAETRFDLSAGKLAELIGVRPQRIASLAGTQKLLQSLGAEAGNLEQTPAIRAASAAVDAADAQLRVAKADRWPSLGITASQSRSSASDSSDDKPFVGLAISGGFSLGGLAQHKVAAAEAEKRASAQALENQRLVTRTALGSAETETAGAAARLVSYNKVIALTRSSRDLYWQEYTLNKRPLTDVINAEGDVYTAEGERINAAADGIVSKIKAYAALGRLTAMLSQKMREQP